MYCTVPSDSDAKHEKLHSKKSGVLIRKDGYHYVSEERKCLLELGKGSLLPPPPKKTKNKTKQKQKNNNNNNNKVLR